MRNFKMQQKLELNVSGWAEAWDGTYQRIEDLDNYNTKSKPLLPLKTKLIHEGMCRRGYITANFEDYFQTAKSFIKAMKIKAKENNI